MKDAFWKTLSLVLMCALIVAVTSWAYAWQNKSSKKAKAFSEEEGQSIDVLIEQDKTRYSIQMGGSRGTDNEKIILFDTWDVDNSKNVWFMKDPHTSRPSWVRIPFSKK